jgi:hypothetical protein
LFTALSSNIFQPLAQDFGAGGLGVEPVREDRLEKMLIDGDVFHFSSSFWLTV